MKKKLLTALLAFTCVLCLAFGLTACGGNGNGDDSGDKMWLNHSQISLNVGESVKLNVEKVVFTDEDYEYYGIEPDGEYWKEFEDLGLTREEILVRLVSVEWSSEDNQIAEVDKDGNVTALAEGSTTIHAYSFNKGHHATCTVYVTDPNKPDIGENPDTPDISVTSEMVFEFYDAESDDYPYLASLKTGMRGQSLTIKPDGTCIAKSGSYTFNGTYVQSGNIFKISLSGSSSTAEYVLDGDLLSSDSVMAGYNVKLIYKLKTADTAPVFTELAGKVFAFENLTSTALNESEVNSLKYGYKNARITFSASGSVEIYNPSDSIDTEPNAYSRQTGTFSCENGEGYVIITAMTAGGETVKDFVEARYTLSFTGKTLTLFAGEITFTYTIVSG